MSGRGHLPHVARFGPGRCRRAPARGAASHDLVVSALALSAFLGAGYTDSGGHEFVSTVQLGLDRLKRAQRADGCFGNGEGPLGLAMHGVVTFATVEAYGMIGSSHLKQSAAKALGVLRASRDRWLTDQRIADVPTALVGWGALAVLSAELVSRGVALLDWVYTALTLGHASEPAWPAWSDAVSHALLNGQRKDGDACSFLGSWNPVGPWGAQGGRVASTALGIMCLSAQIRYDRVEAPK